MAMKDAEKNMAMSKNLVDQYKLGDACESAFTSYRLKLDPEARKYLNADMKLYEAVSNAFYGANSQEELDALMSRTPDELADIGRGGKHDG